MGYLTRLAAYATLATALLAAAPVVAADGACVLATLDEPFRLPDGSLHPAGAIRICPARYTPVTRLLTITTESGDGGYYLGRRTESEDTSQGPPELVFARGRGSTLTLLALRVPERERVIVYWVEAPDARGRGALTAETIERDDEIVRIAAVAGPTRSR